jgi:hypothetical protein
MSHNAPKHYHWVHKDRESQSCTKATASEAYEIRSFVQHQRLLKRKTGELQIKWPGLRAKYTSKSTPLPPPPPHARKVPQCKLIRSKPHCSYKRPRPNHETTRFVTTYLLCWPIASLLLPVEYNTKLVPWETAVWTTLMLDRTPSTRQKHASIDFHPQTTTSTGNAEPKVNMESHDSPAPPASKPEIDQLQGNWRVVNNNFIQGASIDPFARTAVAMNTDHEAFLKYYSIAQMGGGNLYKLHYLPSHVQEIIRPEVIRDEIMANAFLHKHCLYALMAFMSVRMLVVSRRKVTVLKGPTYYMHMAICTLREKIIEHEKSGTAIDRNTICGILQIALADWTSGDLSAARAHIRVLAQLMPFVCRRDDRGMNLNEIIRTLDLEVALESSTTPFLPAMADPDPMTHFRLDQIKRRLNVVAAHYEPSSQSALPFGNQYALSGILSKPTDIMADLTTTLDFRIGTVFEEALDANVLEEAFHPTLRDFIDCLTVAKYVWRTPDATVKDARWMCRAARLAIHQMLAYTCDLPHHRQNVRSALTECTRLALLIMLTLATNRMAVRAVKSLGQGLRLACARADRHLMESDVENKLFLWALMTAAFALADSNNDTLWLIRRAARLAYLRLGLASLEELHETMTLFLYSCSMQASTLREVMVYVDTLKN